ncbi:MAG: hypothetical protein AAF329_11695 [Cyanobacteria bacterium P01_A01_bin.17]
MTKPKRRFTQRQMFYLRVLLISIALGQVGIEDICRLLPLIEIQPTPVHSATDCSEQE